MTEITVGEMKEDIRKLEDQLGMLKGRNTRLLEELEDSKQKLKECGVETTDEALKVLEELAEAIKDGKALAHEKIEEAKRLMNGT